MSFFEWPHTRTYDSDLGWLITAYKKIAADYDSLKEFIDKYPEEYAKIDARITVLENNISSFESEIYRRFSELQSQLSSEIYRQIQAGLSDLNKALGDIYTDIATLHSIITRNRLDLEGQIKAGDSYSITYTDVKIQELINSLPDLTTVNVFNPVRGYITNIQTAVNDLYDLSRSEGLMAIEYDSLGLTAAEYDALQLSALEYDQYARYYLENVGIIKNPFHYMTSPFTGEYVKLEIVINELASLHRAFALTAQEYDLKDLTAEDYDLLLLSAYDYDWNGKNLIA